MTWECPHGYPAAAGCPVVDCPDAAEPSHVERADESEQNVTDSHVFSLRAQPFRPESEGACDTDPKEAGCR